MEKFQKTAAKWSKVQNELRNDCMDFLIRILEKNNKLIDWSEMDIEQDVCVTYDGGNHPEYASNAFSVVRSVSMDDKGNITMDCEDDSDYNINNINTCELYTLCSFIDNYVLEPEKKE